MSSDFENDSREAPFDAENGEKPLKEKDFIYEARGKNPMPMWLFIIIILGIFSILWLGVSWFMLEMETKVEENPFLQVTNREMSLFLWQNPEFMRIHASTKTGYLPGFHSVGKANPKLEPIDEYAAAPPEVMFRYHTWDRLLSGYVMPRPISPEEFQAFLEASPEWKPEYWPEAPEQYKQLIREFDIVKTDNLQDLPTAVFPKKVRNAFLGWKNYYREGDLINKEKPKVGGIRAFLEKYPHYARNYWRNIAPEYLKTLLDESAGPDTVLPDEEVAPFLRVAYFNYKKAQD